MKKLLSLLLAIAMVFSLGVGALAEDSASEATGSGTETGDNKTIGSTDEGKNTASANVTASYTPSTTTTPEAKWGASAGSLTGSGTLTQALDAATATGSTVKYIQLQKSVTMTSGYTITGGAFTLDLNGKTISSGSAIAIGNIASNAASGIDVTFMDSGSGGKVENTTSGQAAITVVCGKVTFQSGTYGYIMMSLMGADVPNADVTITGGTFEESSGNAIFNQGGKLTVTGGSFTSETYAISTTGTTTITGGTFSAEKAHICYNGGKLDLYDYPITPLTGLKVYNGTSTAVTVGADTIKLPTGYAFYESEDTNQTAVTELAAGIFYNIKSTTTDEAKWGASATDLTAGSGTLKQALAAAAASSDVKYIQLQKNVEGYFTITGGTFTLDLNGKTISGSGSHVFTISTGDADVTFTDTATGGKVTATTGAVVLVLDGKLTINKGTYESECDEAVQIVGTVVINDGSFTSMQAGKVAVLNGGTLTINGGSFSGGLGAISIEDNGTTTIKGGSFAAGSKGHISYYGGKLDLTGYKSSGTMLTDLTVYNGGSTAVTVGADTIALPEGYAFAKDGSETLTDTLEGEKTYIVVRGSVVPPEAKWGADEDHLTESGTLAEAIAAANAEGSTVGYIQLQLGVNTTVGYEIKRGKLTIDLNGKTVTSSAAYSFKVNYADTAAYALRAARAATDDNGVTFMDSSDGGFGAVIGTAASGAAISVPSGSVTIESGSFYSNGETTLQNSGGTLTIAGGSIYAGTKSAVTVSGGTTTVTDGSLYSGSDATSGSSIEYQGGGLDVSDYHGVTGLTVHNGSDSDVEHNNNTNITLPDDHGFVDGDGASTTTLASGTTYSIAGTGTGDTTETDEAKWGASETSLTESGSLEEAFKAAKDSSSIKYIQLQKNVTMTSGYTVTGGKFTLDLNGKTITMGSGYTITIGNSASNAASGIDVIFMDSGSGGKVENATSGQTAIIVAYGKATFQSGTYGLIFMSLMGADAPNADVTINGGTFESTDTAIFNQGGKLTVTGGSFTGQKCAISASGTTTITGGKFSAEKDLYYSGGLLDLSGYNGTALTDLTVYINTETVTVGDTTIKLPEGYAFYKSEDTTNQTTVTTLEGYNTYAIKSTSGGVITAEALWGADKDHLTKSGTLKEAISEATAKAGSDVGYIRLNANVRAETPLNLDAGDFTLDLYGYTISGSVTVSGDKTDVIFVDTSNALTGRVESTSAAITVEDGEVTFNGGNYTGDPALRVSTDSDATNAKACVWIDGGSFIGETGAIDMQSGDLTIRDGSFSGLIRYSGGTLDMTEYGVIPDVTTTTPITELELLCNAAGATVGTDIKLPKCYGLSVKGGTGGIVTEPESGKTYKIVHDPEAWWGADKDHLTESGSLEQALNAAELASDTAAYVQLVKDVTVSTYMAIYANKSFTLDLNGHTITSATSNVMNINAGSSEAVVTFVDSSTAGGGKISATGSGCDAVSVQGGTVIIESGSYEGASNALYLNSGTATVTGGSFTTTGNYVISTGAGTTLTIEGGTFTGGSMASMATSGTTKITGGSFTPGSSEHIRYYGGKLDLSAYSGTSALTGLTVYNGVNDTVTVGADTIQLPSGHVFSKDGKTEVTELAKQTRYSIIVEPTKHAVTINASENGKVEADKLAAAAGATVTLTVSPNSGYELDTLTVKQGETDVTTTAGERNTYTFTMPAATVTVSATFKAIPAKITGVSVKVGGTTYTSGQTVTLTPTSGNVTIIVTGTNLQNGTEKNKVWHASSGFVSMEETMGWTVNEAGTEATVVAGLNAFAGCTTVHEIKYSNDGTNYTDTGLCILYQEPVSVSITWGSLAFTYTGGENAVWSCEDGANEVTVTNNSDVAVTASVAYKQAEGYTDISGSFDTSSATLAKSGSETGTNTATFALTLSGELASTTANDTTIGTITVTIGKVAAPRGADG